MKPSIRRSNNGTTEEIFLLEMKTIGSKKPKLKKNMMKKKLFGSSPPVDSSREGEEKKRTGFLMNVDTHLYFIPLQVL